MAWKGKRQSSGRLRRGMSLDPAAALVAGEKKPFSGGDFLKIPAASAESRAVKIQQTSDEESRRGSSLGAPRHARAARLHAVGGSYYSGPAVLWLGLYRHPGHFSLQARKLRNALLIRLSPSTDPKDSAQHFKYRSLPTVCTPRGAPRKASGAREAPYEKGRTRDANAATPTPAPTAAEIVHLQPEAVSLTASGGGYTQQLSAAVYALNAALQPRAHQHELKRVLLQAVKGSDVDSCLVLPGVTQKAEQLARLRVVKYLVELYAFGSAEVIPAQVPIAKVVGTDGLGLLDVSICNSAALANSAFVRVFGELDPRVLQLGRVLKHWAASRGINNRSIELYDARYESPEAAAAAAAETPDASEEAMFTQGSEAVSAGKSKPSGAFFGGDTLRPLPFMSDCTYVSVALIVGICGNKTREAAVPASWSKTPCQGPLLASICWYVCFFCSQIRKEVMKNFAVNTETVGELLRGFFNFYGSALPALSTEAPVTVDCYDASLHVGTTDTAPLDPRALHGEQPARACAARNEQAEGTPPGVTMQTPGWQPAAKWGVWGLPRSAALAQIRSCSPPISTSQEGGSSSCRPPSVLMVRCPLTRCIVNRFSRAAWAAIAAEFTRAERLMQQQQPLTALCAPLTASHRERNKTDVLRYRRLAVALARSQFLLPPPAAAGAAAATTASAAALEVSQCRNTCVCCLRRKILCKAGSLTGTPQRGWETALHNESAASAAFIATQGAKQRVSRSDLKCAAQFLIRYVGGCLAAPFHCPRLHKLRQLAPLQHRNSPSTQK
ncbi:uncharacterized protein LOC34621159 [Cyclospora cayetanensis]|uniref:Uncharacterized protein LOC34621159 n=1 Tax=Cyclospora cayetanensis TaxID=88456 RepID=A0A6P6S486_9EIME|nr:uncharacterized protein LOC34621159 [Cyclospora cayetanensis]